MDMSNYWFEAAPFALKDKVGNTLNVSGSAYVKPAADGIEFNLKKLKFETESVMGTVSQRQPTEDMLASAKIANGRGRSFLEAICDELCLQSGRFPNDYARSLAGVAYCKEFAGVELYDGSPACWYDVEICEDDNQWHLRDDLVEVDGDWYDPDGDLIYSCEHCGRWILADEHCPDCEVEDVDGHWQLRDDCVMDYNGDWRLSENCEHARLRGYGMDYIDEEELENDWVYCDRCSEYVRWDDWDSDHECCCDCAGDDDVDGEITSYHGHNGYSWFGKPDKSGRYIGVGTELELDKNPNSTSPQCQFNQDFAGSLCEKCGLESNELHFECDGSLDTGFEIITQPHTLEDFWAKRECWEKMLEACAEAGFKSHDAGTCGLHVHVSREMFGRTQGVQNYNIAKVYRLYENRWDDFVTASRRKNFSYCDHNALYYKNARLESKDTAYKFRKALEYRNGTTGHNVALNNANRATFEFRLGRGTLNKWSFFSWIDLCVAIANNSKKGLAKLDADNAEWLRGISEMTARYLVKRGAFVEECKRLFPQICWESDTSDGGNAVSA